MDISKLTDDEIFSAAKFYHLDEDVTLDYKNIYVIISKLKKFNIRSEDVAAPELIDLYIASKLNEYNVKIPVKLTTVTPENYTQLAPLLYLPSKYTRENLVRAKRIIRILKDLKERRPVPKHPMQIQPMQRQPMQRQPVMRKLQIMPVIFTSGGKIGDFGWMIQRPEYHDVLFLYNDNEEQFRQFMTNKNNPNACKSGGGNAII